MGTQVPSLVGELRSLILHDAAKTKLFNFKKKKKKGAREATSFESTKNLHLKKSSNCTVEGKRTVSYLGN